MENKISDDFEEENINDGFLILENDLFEEALFENMLVSDFLCGFMAETEAHPKPNLGLLSYPSR